MGGFRKTYRALKDLQSDPGPADLMDGFLKVLDTPPMMKTSPAMPGVLSPGIAQTDISKQCDLDPARRRGNSPDRGRARKIAAELARIIHGVA